MVFRLLRTLTLALALGGLVLLGYWRIRAHDQQAAVRELAELNEQMRQRLRARAEMLERLSRSRRLAHVQILDQAIAADGTVLDTDVRFIELDDDGSELVRQEFTIPGDVVFIDAWTVKFAPEDVALGHPLFGRALVLLRRVYSDRMAPIDGFSIDTPGAVPPAYAAGDMGRFERRIWAQFWQIATDPELAATLGVRVAQGEVVYKPVAPGQVFSLRVDAIGGMSLTPIRAADAGTS